MPGHSSLFVFLSNFLRCIIDIAAVDDDDASLSPCDSEFIFTVHRGVVRIFVAKRLRKADTLRVFIAAVFVSMPNQHEFVDGNEAVPVADVPEIFRQSVPIRAPLFRDVLADVDTVLEAFKAVFLQRVELNRSVLVGIPHIEQNSVLCIGFFRMPVLNRTGGRQFIQTLLDDLKC